MILQNGLFPTVIAPLIEDVNLRTFVYFAFVFAVFLISYLLGSINTSIIVSKCIYHTDVRTLGSGNAGLTNTLRNFGGKAALMTMLGDVLKTALGIFIAGLVFGFWYDYAICNNYLVYFAGLFSVIGHIFPVYYGFKGGKGVLATSITALMLSPIEFGILILLFVGIVLISKYVSLGSVIVVFLYPLLVYLHHFILIGTGLAYVLLPIMIIAILIIFCHRKNLQRIAEHSERKLSFGSKRREAAEAELREKAAGEALHEDDEDGDED